MSDNDDVARGVDMAPSDEMPHVRRRITCASVGWSCPLTGAYLECRLHLEVPTRQNCFNCGINEGWQQCALELKHDDQLDKPEGDP